MSRHNSSDDLRSIHPKGYIRRGATIGFALAAIWALAGCGGYHNNSMGAYPPVGTAPTSGNPPYPGTPMHRGRMGR